MTNLYNKHGPKNSSTTEEIRRREELHLLSPSTALAWHMTLKVRGAKWIPSWSQGGESPGQIPISIFPLPAPRSFPSRLPSRIFHALNSLKPAPEPQGRATQHSSTTPPPPSPWALPMGSYCKKKEEFSGFTLRVIDNLVLEPAWASRSAWLHIQVHYFN